MSSPNDAPRSRRRRELDARRSKSRVRLGSCLESWGQLKEKLGFSLHSELAQHLLESYVSRVCTKCSGDAKGQITNSLSTTKESLQELILLVHHHGQTCLFPPVLHSWTVTKPPERAQSAHATGRLEAETDSTDSSEVDLCLKYTCEDGHHFLWSPIKIEKVMTSKNEGELTASSSKRLKQRGRKLLKEPEAKIERQEMMSRLKTRRQIRESAEVTRNDTERGNGRRSETFGDRKNAGVTVTETPETQTGNDVAADFSLPEYGCPIESDEMTEDDLDCNEEVTVLNLTTRGIQSSTDPTEKQNANKKAGAPKNSSPQSLKDDISQIGGKRKRKSTSNVILLCEFEGCDKIFSSRQYLNHHVKYQHLHQKTFTCLHPSCSKSFNFKKHLKEHEKLHSSEYSVHMNDLCDGCHPGYFWAGTFTEFIW